MDLLKCFGFWEKRIVVFSFLFLSLEGFTQEAENDYIQFYQKFISPVRYKSCGMYPSCSRYSMMCFRETGFFNGMFFTADRLMRCCNIPLAYPRIELNENWYYLDYPPTHPSVNPQRFYFNISVDGTAASTEMFIQNLMRRGLYSEALSEISRALFFQADVSDSIYLLKLQCYEALEQNDKALQEYNNYPAKVTENPRIRLEVAGINLRERNFEEVQRICSGFQIYEHYHNVAQTYRGIACLWQNQLEDAGRFFESGINASQNLAKLDEYRCFKRKNPRLATFYSIIPGGGYWYCGGKRTAVTSFLINGLLGYAVYTSVKSKNYGLASLLGILNISFYFGNVKGANLSAKRYNAYKENNIKNDLYLNNRFN